MPVTRIRHNIAGYYALRSEPGVRARLEQAGRSIHSEVGGDAAGYGFDSRQGAKRPQGRWRVSVAALSFEARLDNARNHRLLRAMGAGRRA